MSRHEKIEWARAFIVWLLGVLTGMLLTASRGISDTTCEIKIAAAASEYAACVSAISRAGVNPARVCRMRPVICPDYKKFKRWERKRNW